MRWLRDLVRHNRIERSLNMTERANCMAMARALAESTPNVCEVRMTFAYESRTRTVTIVMDFAFCDAGKCDSKALNRRAIKSRTRVRHAMANDSAVATMLCQAPRRMNVAYAIAV